jgi:hypothetical protein
MVLLLEVLSFLVERVKYGVKILENVERMFEHGYSFTLLKDNQAISSLV